MLARRPGEHSLPVAGEPRQVRGGEAREKVPTGAVQMRGAGLPELVRAGGRERGVETTAVEVAALAAHEAVAQAQYTQSAIGVPPTYSASGPL